MKTAQTVLARKRKKLAKKYTGRVASKCTVYALTDNEGYIRYVGQTRGQTDIRYNYHLKDAYSGGNSPVQRWIASGKCSGITVLQDNAVWMISEALWIKSFKDKGARLLNVSKEHDEIYRAMAHDYSLPDGLEINAVVQMDG